ncbi:MAG: response regulator [Spirochaetia bacterium]|nr:response regulator [Spirochaetia bacterium]
MREKASEHPTLSWAGNVIERQVSHLSRLVDDLLDVNRVINGSLQLKKEAVELTEVINLALESIRPQIEIKKLKLTVNFQGESMRILGDPVRLSQILSNLLDNATRYTQEGGSIKVTIEKEGVEAVLKVSDSGMGISKESLPGLFNTFAQDPTQRDRSESGLGIGLVLVRRLVEMHGGSVEARSAGAGLGSEFIACFPIVMDGVSPSRKTDPASGEKTSGSPVRRVLVVDDNLDSAESLLIFLELRGHKAFSANDGPSALEMAAKIKPHIIFLDIDLPGMDGFEVARKIRSIPGLKFVSLVALTGYGLEEYRQRSTKAGIDLHLVKPVESRRIESVIQQLTSSAFSEAQHT